MPKAYEQHVALSVRGVLGAMRDARVEDHSFTVLCIIIKEVIKEKNVKKRS